MIPLTQQIPENWQNRLKSAISTLNDSGMAAFLAERQAAGAVIYPPEADIFNALKLTAPEAVKVVILGQDPYHQPGQAHGLAFSVTKACRKLPPSLKNIFKELQADLNFPIPQLGDLTDWSKQGVFLLNTLLTVEEGQPMAHKNRGWEGFTDAIISALNDDPTPKVFILWGNPARAKAPLITHPNHHILESAHPSPLAASRGFFGSAPFSKANHLLKSSGRKPINWALHEPTLFDL